MFSYAIADDGTGRGGLEGAVRSMKTGDVRTARVSEANDEDRSEPIESSVQGLPKSLSVLLLQIHSINK
ncbi:hypothetical protein BRD04_06800 [Halobacteriales archaeon QS_9_67_17]|nr:MAG: hypothetical protein BRD04_06800 [Halobacteriales archaeon QS_9_67_17]